MYRLSTSPGLKTSKTMKILALDTATEACSAALYNEGEIVHQFQLAPREHTKLILKMAEQLLAQSGIALTELDGLAFGRGPGSFTGIRIATGVIQGLGFAADLPVVGVSTLASIAQAVSRDHQQQNVLATIDARMGGIYWGCYRLGDNPFIELVGEERVTAPEDIALPEEHTFCVAGSAVKAYQAALEGQFTNRVSHYFPDYLPTAETMVELAVADYQKGLAVPAHQALPVYLRNNVAKKAKDQK